MFRRCLTVVFGLLAVTTFACSSDEDDRPTTTNGVNDVGKACAIRAQWTRVSSLDCTDCLGIAVTPICDCTASKPYAGRCAEQQTAKYQERACAGVGECAFSCPTNDCACVEACYANNEACRVRAAALDGCLAEVCDTYCR